MTHIAKLWGRITHRHNVKMESVGVFNVDDYTERYAWLSENVPDFKKTIWIDATVSSITDLITRTVDKQLSGTFRFKYRTDALAFVMRWA
jgi:hypothetical protein